MRRISVCDLQSGRWNVFEGVLSVGRIKTGGLHFFKAGEVAHSEEVRHVHTDHCEIFINLQGRGVVEIEGIDHAFEPGDVILIDPGESHHVRSDNHEPLVNLWLAVETAGK